ncbi:MAG: ABC transporter ATP-binding protein [Deltaproteobacteria bacterium]|nr:ABC transporter ATP-binding protein [Deltaproteobacteria bacterium]
MLSVHDLTVHYGKALALDRVSLEVAEGAVVSIIGANGAGKSTILKAVSGMTPLTSGAISFRDRSIAGLKTPATVKLGLVHVPEGRKLFPFLTVRSNIELGASTRKDRDGIRKDMEEVFRYFPILETRNAQKAGTLSGGEQQMLAIARGLMAKPKLLMLDEPSLGLAPLIVASLVPVIRTIHQRGVGVLLVEQNIPLALQVADTGYALRVGRIVLQGPINEFKTSEVVKEAYLGG